VQIVHRQQWRATTATATAAVGQHAQHEQRDARDVEQRDERERDADRQHEPEQHDVLDLDDGQRQRRRIDAILGNCTGWIKT
jgi:hypothetical protein